VISPGDVPKDFSSAFPLNLHESYSENKYSKIAEHTTNSECGSILGLHNWHFRMKQKKLF
jgi:hypothetical protein